MGALSYDRNGIHIWTMRGPQGKRWAYIETCLGPAPFSFRDQYEIVRALCECEVEKYDGLINEQTWEKRTRMPRDFLLACFEFDAEYDLLRRQFRLPR